MANIEQDIIKDNNDENTLDIEEYNNNNNNNNNVMLKKGKIQILPRNSLNITSYIRNRQSEEIVINANNSEYIEPSNRKVFEHNEMTNPNKPFFPITSSFSNSNLQSKRIMNFNINETTCPPNQTNQFSFKNTKTEQCLIKIKNCLNTSTKKKIIITLLCLSCVMLIISSLQLFKHVDIMNNEIYFSVEVILILLDVCMMLVQLCCNKIFCSKIVLVVYICVLSVCLGIQINVFVNKVYNVVYVIENCVVCLVLVVGNAMLFGMVVREIRFVKQKHQHIEEIINFTETNVEKKKGRKVEMVEFGNGNEK
jgi:hypothetical protein